MVKAGKLPSHSVPASPAESLFRDVAARARFVSKKKGRRRCDGILLIWVNGYPDHGPSGQRWALRLCSASRLVSVELSLLYSDNTIHAVCPADPFASQSQSSAVTPRSPAPSPSSSPPSPPQQPSPTISQDVTPPPSGAYTSINSVWPHFSPY